VAVYRGVNGSIAGISLASLEERTGLDVERLDPIARPQVERGYVADGRDDALAYVQRLQERAAALCPPAPEPAAAPPAPGTAPPDPAPTSFGAPPTDPECPA
jgi:protein phosphatase